MAKKTTQAQVYHLDASHDGKTLAAVVKDLHGATTWGQVKKWIRGRYIQVNGNLCLDEARRLTPKDVIKLHPQPLAKPVEVADLRLAYYDEHLLVAQKPAGVTSVRHAAERDLSTRRRQIQPTLEELLPAVLAKVQRLRWPPLPPKGMNRGREITNRKQRPHGQLKIQNPKRLPPELQVIPVHRLDRDTSGMMLFARTKYAEQKLVQLFRRHAIEREYVAFCYGQVEPQTIQSWLVRDRGDGQRGSCEQGEAGNDSGKALKATTHLLASKPLAESGFAANFSRVRCKLETGRTHQIRIHLSELGHPICGDKIYFRAPGREPQHDTSRAPRQALHSDKLEFVHPITDEKMCFEMPLPNDLTAWLQALKARSPS